MVKATQLVAIFFITLALIFAIVNVGAAIALGIAGIIALLTSQIFTPAVRNQSKQIDRNLPQKSQQSVDKYTS